MKPLALVALVFALAGCSLVDSEGDALSRYDYLARDASGNAVAGGTLWIQVIPTDVAGEPHRVEGRWEVEEPVHGLFGDGEGRLTGTVDPADDRLFVTFELDVTDTGYYLAGEFSEDQRTITGEWLTSGYGGDTSVGGAFESRLERQARRFLRYP